MSWAFQHVPNQGAALSGYVSYSYSVAGFLQNGQYISPGDTVNATLLYLAILKDSNLVIERIYGEFLISKAPTFMYPPATRGLKTALHRVDTTKVIDWTENHRRDSLLNKMTYNNIQHKESVEFDVFAGSYPQHWLGPSCDFSHRSSAFARFILQERIKTNDAIYLSQFIKYGKYPINVISALAIQYLINTESISIANEVRDLLRQFEQENPRILRCDYGDSKEFITYREALKYLSFFFSDE